jgi:hypothetical protein
MRKKRLAAFPVAALILVAIRPSASAGNEAPPDCVKVQKEIHLGKAGGFAVKAVHFLVTERNEDGSCEFHPAAGGTSEIQIVATSPKREKFAYSLVFLSLWFWR